MTRSLSRIQTIAFDFDGTLLDSLRWHERGWRQVLAEAGAHADRASIRECITEGLTAPEVVDRLIREERVSSERREWIIQRKRALFDQVIPTRVKLIAGAKTTLKALARRGYRLSIASGARKVAVETILEREGLRSRFDLVLTGAELGEGERKPSPWVLKEIARRLAIPLARLAFVGDSLADMETARRAGVPFILANLTPGFELDTKGSMLSAREIRRFAELLSFFPGKERQ